MTIPKAGTTGGGNSLFAGGRNPFSDIKLPGGEQEQQGGEKKEKQNTKFWLNVGIERGGKLVSLPMGIPLDNLKPKAIPGPSTKNQDFRFLRMAESQLFDKVQEIKATMKPGEVCRLPFIVELRMTDEKVEPTEEEFQQNPYAIENIEVTRQTVATETAPAEETAAA